jgi:3-oxoacyl-[acyl-carrier protein] reductase
MNFLITGGASGLGETITITLSTQYPKATVFFTYCSSLQSAANLEAAYKNTKAIKCDFNNPDDVNALCFVIKNENIGFLINNALSKISIQYFHKIANDDILEAFRLDVLATLQITKQFIINARANRQGKIITILSSYLTGNPSVGLSVYLANKTYLLAMHKSWATENISFNITSNCVSPSFMQTPLNKDTDERLIENMIIKHPLKKLLTTQEVADTVLYLCNSTSQINGQNITLNAGTQL